MIIIDYFNKKIKELSLNRINFLKKIAIIKFHIKIKMIFLFSLLFQQP